MFTPFFTLSDNNDLLWCFVDARAGPDFGNEVVLVKIPQTLLLNAARCHGNPVLFCFNLFQNANLHVSLLMLTVSKTLPP